MKPETYKAAIYRDVGKVEIVEMPYPVCGDDDVIVKNHLSGICGSDINAFHKGGDPHMVWKDHEFGHEMLSEVVEIGKNVTDVAVGDYVWPNLGHALRDRNRMATVGGFSEYIRIIQYEEGYSAFKMDKSIPIESLVLMEPFIISTRGARAVNPTPGKNVIVFGAGLIGMACAIMLKYYGCDKVMIVDLSDYRLRNAEKMGLIPCNSSKEDLIQKAKEVFGTQQSIQGEVCGADAYVDCVGLQPVVDSYAKMARRKAELIVVGVHHKPVTLDFVRLCYGGWVIKGSSGSVVLADAVHDIQDMMKSTKLDLSQLVSHKYPLSGIVDALKMASDVDAAQKVCIEFD